MAARSLRELFDAYWDADPAARDTLLREVEADDAALAERLRQLIAADTESDTSIASPVLPTRVEPGRCLGDFRITESLGAGGMGSVFLAEQERPVRRLVALKVMPWQASMDPEQRARFTAERQALASLSHPNVASFFAAGETEDGLAYFAMEHVDGLHIDRYCQAHRLDVRERLGLLLQVCAGVAHAHRKGVIHRDLKPANVLVTGEPAQPVVKIIDFGIAKAAAAGLRPETFETHAGRIVGTLNYMSPEQARGDGGADTRVDVYALGALLYRVLTGRTPFDFRPGDVTLAEIFGRLENEDPRRPSELVAAEGARIVPGLQDRAALAAALRGDLDWICLKAVERDPRRRYASAGDLARDLRAHLDDLPVDARPPTLSYRWSKFFARNRPAVLALGSILAAAVLTAAWSFHQARRVQVEAATANEVITLMREAFSAADPGKGRELTVDDVLDRAAANLETLAPANPARARLAMELADVYANLGRPERALPLWESAHALEVARAGEESAPVLRALTGRAVALRELSRFGESEAVLEKVLAIQEAAHGEGSREALLARVNLIGHYQALMQHDRALPLLEAVYEHARARYGPRHLDTLRIAANLAVALKPSDPERAVTLIDEALAGLAERPDVDQVMLIGLEYNRVTALAEAQRFEPAIERVEALYPRAEALLGPTHPLSLTIQEFRGHLLGSTGDPERACAILEAVLAVRRDHFGAAHVGSLRVAANLLEFRLERGDPPAELADAIDPILLRLETVVDGESTLLRQVYANAVEFNVLAGRDERARELLAAGVLDPATRADLAERETVANWFSEAGR